ncbi:MAG TPA: tyrosine-type recombinase/integrase [Solirubrobacteraceae bacterium]|jgi:integrase|nr:tyrosine-type recombinase/integrase [Solirubrobacteraceae bacterium]
MADTRKLEKTSTAGIYRRHAASCKRNGRCKCSYVVRWKENSKGHNRLFPTFDLAREFKGEMASGKVSRKPLSSETVGGYYEGWIGGYRGRTVRGVQASTVREYKISFEHHVLPLAIARTKLRDLTPSAVREWFVQLERRNASPATIKRARIALRVMLACAVEDDDITSNAAADVRYIPTEDARARHTKPEPKKLTAADIVAILQAMPEQWRAFFFMLAQTGVRVGELLGLTWQHVHLGDDAHIVVAEQVYRGERKRLKTDSSSGRVPLSPFIASWLVELRPDDAEPDSPVFPSTAGTPLVYANVYNRVLRPALERSGIAVQTGTVTVRKRGEDVEEPVWDYQRVAFHAFRHACGTLLHAMAKRPVQAQGWLRHSQLMTTMNIYTHLDDEGLGGADAFDEILAAESLRVQPGSTGHPETAANQGGGW